MRSSWEGGSGGSRKVYELTEAGHDLLAFWVQRLKAEQAGVARFLKSVRRAK